MYNGIAIIGLNGAGKSTLAHVLAKKLHYFEIDVEDYYIQTDFAGNEFKNFVDKLKSRSEYDFNVEVNNDDQILTLSTCGISSKYRVVVHAVKVK